MLGQTGPQEVMFLRVRRFRSSLQHCVNDILYADAAVSGLTSFSARVDMPIFPKVGTSGTKILRKLLSRRSSVGRAADS
jgi:hypothetical protein